MKCGLLFDHFGPYHVARAKAAAGRCELVAIAGGTTSSDYAWRSPEYDGLTLKYINRDGPSAALSGTRLRRRLFELLDNLQLDCIAVPGWSSRLALGAVLWAVRRRVPIVIMSESTAWDRPRRRFGECLKRRVVSFATSGFVGGDAHVEYLVQLGMSRQRIFLGYDAVDNEYFSAAADRYRAAADNGAAISVNSTPYFLASARFIEKKNLFRLIDAYTAYCHVLSEMPRWGLCLLGDGELRPKMLEHIRTRGLTVAEVAPWERSRRNSAEPAGHVYLPGFQQIEALPKYYAGAGCFVHASSSEQWGLVVNEAMASRLPVLVSNRCGCCGDLVDDGRNGFAFEPFDTAQLSALMRQMTEMPVEQRLELGNAAHETISRWGVERFAEGFSESVACAVRHRENRSSPLARFVIAGLAMR